MQQVVFKTQGSLDLRAVTTFGINSKPNSQSPIGFFGTGLKYAIAVLVRSGAGITIISDGKKHTFNLIQDTFRDKEFDFIEMQEHSVLRWVKKTRLPYTTELGKTWKMWQAFRELYSNTLDENGETYLGHSDVEKGYTYIIIDSEEFTHEFHERDKVFLPEGLRYREGDAVQIIDKPSEFVYYRGMRVYELQKPTVVTYNILTPIDLTEDRTAKYPHFLNYYIRNAVVTANNPDVVENALTADKEKHESGLDFKEATDSPSDTFIYVARKLKEEKRSFNHSSLSYIRRWDDSAAVSFRARHWTKKIADAIDDDNWDDLVKLIQENKSLVQKLFEEAIPEYDGTEEEE